MWLHPPPESEVGDEWNINFLNYGTNKKIDNKFSKIRKIKKMLWNSYTPSFLHIFLVFFPK